MTRITLLLTPDEDQVLDLLCQAEARDPRLFAKLLLSRALREELASFQKTSTPTITPLDSAKEMTLALPTV